MARKFKVGDYVKVLWPKPWGGAGIIKKCGTKIVTVHCLEFNQDGEFYTICLKLLSKEEIILWKLGLLK